MFLKDDIVYWHSPYTKKEYKYTPYIIYKVFKDFYVICEKNDPNRCHHVDEHEIELILV